MSTFILPLFSSSFQKSLMLQKLPIMFLGKIVSGFIKHDFSKCTLSIYMSNGLAWTQNAFLLYFVRIGHFGGEKFHGNIFSSPDFFYFGSITVSECQTFPIYFWKQPPGDMRHLFSVASGQQPSRWPGVLDARSEWFGRSGQFRDVTTNVLMKFVLQEMCDFFSTWHPFQRTHHWLLKCVL